MNPKTRRWISDWIGPPVALVIFLAWGYVGIRVLMAVF